VSTNENIRLRGIRGATTVDAALTCMQEMYVPGSLPMCIRILMHVNTPKRQDEVRFVYLRGAKVLRPDIAGEAK
jgi:chorismate mutase